MRRTFFAITLSAALIFSAVIVPYAGATSIESCRIKAMPNQGISLGFPIKPERLANLVQPRVLVIPIRLSDEPNYQFTQSFNDDYKQAAANISTLSNGKSSVNFIFNQPVDIKFSTDDMIQLQRDQQSSFANNLAKSTWGFVRNFISAQDSGIDFTGIDAVVLEGSVTKGTAYIGEAMTFTKNAPNPWFESIKTAEATISNTVLLDRHSSATVITHELMHLFGLADLYGNDIGPGQLSLMAGQNIKLLAYEKWLLGWLPDSSVTCVLPTSGNSISKVSLQLNKGDQLAVIQPSQGSPYIAETSTLDGKNYFAFYKLDNSARPPITLYQSVVDGHHDGVRFSDYTFISSRFVGPDFSTVISNFTSTSLTIDVYKSSFENSSSVSQLLTAATKAKAAALLATQKKITITCVRGKLIKKITAIRPFCPAGYAKK